MPDKKNNNKVTMRDIAEKVGVSRQAVAAVLNNSTNCRVSREKRERIEEIAKKLNYRKNFGVSLLRREKTPTAAIVYFQREGQDQVQEHLKDLIFAVSRKFDLNGYALYLLKTPESAQYNIDRIHDMIDRGCSYFIFVSSVIGCEEIYDIVKGHDLKYVGYGTKCGRDIIVDTAKARARLIDYCREKSNGHYKVIYPEFDGGADALPNFLPDVYDDENLMTFKAKPEYDMADWAAIGAEYTEKTMRRHPDTKAIAYFSDYYALGGCARLSEMGYVPGKDVIVSGLNNLMPCCLTFPINSADHDVERVSELMYAKIFDDELFTIKTDMRFFFR